MDAFWKLIELMYTYQKDQAVGRPYWEDTKLVGLVVGMASTELAKLCGVQIGSDLQLKIVVAAVGIGALFDKKTGIVQNPEEKSADLAKAVQAPNPDDPHGLNQV